MHPHKGVGSWPFLIYMRLGSGMLAEPTDALGHPLLLEVPRMRVRSTVSTAARNPMRRRASRVLAAVLTAWAGSVALGVVTPPAPAQAGYTTTPPPTPALTLSAPMAVPGRRGTVSFVPQGSPSRGETTHSSQTRHPFVVVGLLIQKG